MQIPDRLAPVLDSVRRRIDNEMMSNERLVLMLFLAAALVWFSALYGLWSATAQARAQLDTAKTSLARLQVEVTGDAWPKRVEDSQALKLQLNNRLWQAQTAGLAEASFDAWLRNHFGKNGAQPQQIQITRSPAVDRDGLANPTLSDVQRMTAKVLAPFDPAAIGRVLADIVEADKIIVVDRLILRAGSNNRLEMDVSTFIRTAEARTAPKDRP